MTDKSRKSKSILDIILLVPAILNFIYKITYIVRYEAELAGKSLITIFILAVTFAVLLTSSWICVLGLLLVYLINYLHVTWIMSLLILLLVNILFSLVIIFSILKTRKNLFFRRTCQECLNLLSCDK